METKYKYWMVHCTHGLPPKVKHLSKCLAFEEAERLSATEPGKVFTVLEATHSFSTEKPRVSRRELVDDPGPFTSDQL